SAAVVTPRTMMPAYTSQTRRAITTRASATRPRPRDISRSRATTTSPPHPCRTAAALTLYFGPAGTDLSADVARRLGRTGVRGVDCGQAPRDRSCSYVNAHRVDRPD